MKNRKIPETGKKKRMQTDCRMQQKHRVWSLSLCCFTYCSLFLVRLLRLPRRKNQNYELGLLSKSLSLSPSAFEVLHTFFFHAKGVLHTEPDWAWFVRVQSSFEDLQSSRLLFWTQWAHKFKVRTPGFPLSDWQDPKVWKQLPVRLTNTCVGVDVGNKHGKGVDANVDFDFAVAVVLAIATSRCPPERNSHLVLHFSNAMPIATPTTKPQVPHTIIMANKGDIGGLGKGSGQPKLLSWVKVLGSVQKQEILQSPYASRTKLRLRLRLRKCEEKVSCFHISNCQPTFFQIRPWVDKRNQSNSQRTEIQISVISDFEKNM